MKVAHGERNVGGRLCRTRCAEHTLCCMQSSPNARQLTTLWSVLAVLGRHATPVVCCQQAGTPQRCEHVVVESTQVDGVPALQAAVLLLPSRHTPEAPAMHGEFKYEQA